jgi:hypothetical protein
MGGTVDALAYKADVPNRIKDNIADRVDGVKSAIAGTATKMTSAVTGTAGRVGDAVGDHLPDGADVRRGAVRTVGMVKENPLGVLISGIAVGFLIGSLLPATDLENERLGELGDNLKSKVQDAGSQALEHGKAVLRDTVQAAQQSAEEHGQQLADQTRESMQPTAATQYSNYSNYVNPATE